MLVIARALALLLFQRKPQKRGLKVTPVLSIATDTLFVSKKTSKKRIERDKGGPGDSLVPSPVSKKTSKKRIESPPQLLEMRSISYIKVQRKPQKRGLKAVIMPRWYASTNWPFQRKPQKRGLKVVLYQDRNREPVGAVSKKTSKKRIESITGT